MTSQGNPNPGTFLPPAPDGPSENPRFFGTFGGVFTPTLLTILGVINLWISPREGS